jgi:ribonuclease-3
LIVTDYIYRAFPELPEGELAKVRAAVVSAAALAEVAADLELGDALLLGKGEAGSGGREKPSILADALEAVLGAVYLVGGWDAAQRVIMDVLGDRIMSASEGPGGQDYKTRLQELVARHFPELPRYTIRDEGPDHAKQFFAEVRVDGILRGTGEGRSKKQAEASAARAAWEVLRLELDVGGTGAAQSDTKAADIA